MSLGDYAPASVLDLKFSTFVDTTPTTLAGSPVVSVYKDNSTTQTTTGVTLTVDFDGITGCHNVRVDTADAFYAAGSHFQVVVTTGTVGGNSIAGFVIDDFTLNKMSALRPTTAGRTLDVTATGGAGIDWSNVENPTTALNLSGTNIDVDQVVASVSGNVTGSIGSLATQAKADVNAEVDTAIADVGLTTTITGRIDAAISTRMATFTLPTNFSAFAINASGHVILQDASLVTAKLGTFALAKTTNITGFNDIAATAVVSGGAITTSSGAVSTVTTTTNLTNLPTIPANWLTAAGLAADAVTEIQSGLATSAQAVKLLAACYDSATLSGSTLTLSNAATMVVSSTGRVTT